MNKEQTDKQKTKLK